jgi:hypothetical protein
MGTEAVRVLAIVSMMAIGSLAQDREVPIDNRLVKVIQVHRAMPGVKTRPHRHEMNRVMIYLNAGGQNITWEEGGRLEKLVWKAGEALWSPRGGMHVAEITGSEPARIVEVELKREAGKWPATVSARNPVELDARHYSVDFERPQVQVLRVRLGAGEKTPMIEHSMPRLVTYLTEQDLEISPAGGPTRREARRAGQVEWLEPAVESIRNAGPSPAEAVVIYFNE